VVVVVLVEGDVVVVVVLVEGDVVVVVVVVVDVDVVVVVDLGGNVVVGVVGGGDSGGVDVRKLPADVPPELLDAPMSEERGRPPSTSTSVTRPSARMNDATTVTTNGQRGCRGGRRGSPAAVVRGIRARLHATSRVSPTSPGFGTRAIAALVGSPEPRAEPEVGSFPGAGAEPEVGSFPGARAEPEVGSFPGAGAEPDPASTEASTAEERASALTSPTTRVAQRCTNGRRWPFFTTTSRTFECVRSIDSQTIAVTVVATMLPTATPITVPDTPKTDAISADRTAPLAEAAIWTGFSRFMGVA
jgi:hypothetical protein